MSADQDNFNETAQAEPAALPLDAWHKAKGARMVPFAGYSMPIQYEGIMAEHQWTREHAGLFDVSHMGQLGFGGEGADKALETILPGDITGLKSNRMRYSLLLAADGGILDDLMVTRLPGESPFAPADLYMVVNGATKWDDIAYLRENLPDEITINHMEDQALLALQGPQAAQALAKLIPGAAQLFFMQCGGYQWRSHDVWISRSGYTGEDGFEISIPADAVEAFAEELCALPEVKPIGLGARDSLRLEAGLPLYGHDLTENLDPVTADLSFAISKRRRAEGGFAGAERILGLLANGAPMMRVGLTLDGRLPAREGARVFAGGRDAGLVTSGGFAPTVGAPIAMAYVPGDLATPGTEVEIEVRGKRLSATVSPMPFVTHNYHRQGASQ